MPQSAQDIISRSVWGTDDELFELVKPQELVNSLDRVYREFCRRTRILSSMIGFFTTGNTMEYDLNGPITGSSDTFGDEILGFYRVEYNGKPTQEDDVDDILDARIIGLNSRDNDVIHYAIRYNEKYLRFFLPFNPSDNDEVDFWWYKIPRIGTISTLSSTFAIDDKYTDDLILGLDIYAWHLIGIRQAKKEQILIQKLAQGDRTPYYFSLAKSAFEQKKMAEEKWEKRLLEVRREVAAYKNEVTPVQIKIGQPFTTELDDSFMEEIDYKDL